MLQPMEMKDIIIYAVVVALLGAAARIVAPYSKKFVAWLINFLVNKAENKIRQSGMGKVKKEWVIKKLKWFGIEATEVISDAIDDAVDVMNRKKTDTEDIVKEEVKKTISDQIDHTAATIADKITNHKS